MGLQTFVLHLSGNVEHIMVGGSVGMPGGCYRDSPARRKAHTCPGSCASEQGMQWEGKAARLFPERPPRMAGFSRINLPTTRFHPQSIAGLVTVNGAEYPVCEEVDAWMEKAMAPHSSTLAWKIPWTEEPGRLQSMGSRRVEHD